MNVLQHLNIHSIIDENAAISDPSNKADLSENAQRIALLKSADVQELHLFKISGKCTQEQLSRLKDNIGSRIETCVHDQERTFLKAFYTIVSHALLMKSEDKDITHINLPCHQEEISYLNYRDLAILNEIDLFNARPKHVALPQNINYQQLAFEWYHLIIDRGRRLHHASKKVFIKAQIYLAKLRKAFPDD